MVFGFFGGVMGLFRREGVFRRCEVPFVGVLGPLVLSEAHWTLDELGQTLLAE